MNCYRRKFGVHLHVRIWLDPAFSFWASQSRNNSLAVQYITGSITHASKLCPNVHELIKSTSQYHENITPNNMQPSSSLLVSPSRVWAYKNAASPRPRSSLMGPQNISVSTASACTGGPAASLLWATHLAVYVVCQSQKREMRQSSQVSSLWQAGVFRRSKNVGFADSGQKLRGKM